MSNIDWKNASLEEVWEHSWRAALKTELARGQRADEELIRRRKKKTENQKEALGEMTGALDSQGNPIIWQPWISRRWHAFFGQGHRSRCGQVQYDSLIIEKNDPPEDAARCQVCLTNVERLLKDDSDVS